METWLVVLVIPGLLAASPKEYTFRLLSSSTFKAQPTCTLKMNLFFPVHHKATPRFLDSKATPSNQNVIIHIFKKLTTSPFPAH